MGPAGLAETSASAFIECPLNTRVWLNSPSLCPTMFSATYTGMNLRPLCTAMVCPTMSGCTVERRDHVRNTFFSLRLFMSSMRDIRCTSMKGPFFVDLAMCYSFMWLLLLRPAGDDELVCPLVVACLVPAGRLSPRR